MLFLGYDVGSSAVKACLLDGESGRALGRASDPPEEMPMESPAPGWAEQHPDLWWTSLREATRALLARTGTAPRDVGAIGIGYQMHGLVLVDEAGRVLRPAILWCDGRAVEVGERLFRRLGAERCLDRLLGSPGNFTASKLAWVRENEPDVFERARRMLLPGDAVAFRMTGRPGTTMPGLSEAMLWDFVDDRPAAWVLEGIGADARLLPELVPTFGEQGRLTAAAAADLGLAEGTPVAFRAGDQPTNALALGVVEPATAAATAGTSGVVFGVTDRVRVDGASRVNSFAHVTHEATRPRLGVLLCINGAGSANRWLRTVAGGGRDYGALNELAAAVPPGSDGLVFLPFGNGPERMLGNREPGAAFHGLRFNLHGAGHLARAVQEGVAFAFRYGLEVLGELDARPGLVRAPSANLFLSPVFREALATVGGVAIELYATEGAEGAARGAAVGAGHWTLEEGWTGLERRALVEPDASRADAYEAAYAVWRAELDAALGG